MSASTPSDVCALIVNWNSREDSAALANSLWSEYQMPVVVVDNASDEECESLSEIPGVTLLRSATNRGYGGGMNVAVAEAARAGFSWAWLLNPDCRPEPGALHELWAHSAGRVGVGALQSTGPEAATAYVSAARVSGHRIVSFQCLGCADRVHDVDVLTGTGILVRLDEVLAAGSFDESFFHYKEEFDLLARMAERGRLAHACHARIRHDRGGSLSHESPAAAYYHARNELLYYGKRLSGLPLRIRQVRWMGRVSLRTIRERVSGSITREVGRARYQGLADGVRRRGGRIGT